MCSENVTKSNYDALLLLQVHSVILAHGLTTLSLPTPPPSAYTYNCCSIYSRVYLLTLC